MLVPGETMTLIVVIAVVLVLALLIWALFQPLALTFSARIDGLLVDLRVDVAYSRIHRGRTWHLPVLPPQKKDAARSHLDLTPTLIDEALWAYQVLNRVSDALWHRMRVQKFELTAQIGLNDAASTALWMGRLSELAAWWIGMRVAPRASVSPSFAIIPVWDEAVLTCNFTSIIQLLPSDIILAIVSGLFGQVKGGHDIYGKPVQHHQHA